MVGTDRYTRILYIYQISKFIFDILIRAFFYEVSLGLYRIYCLPFVKSMNGWTVSNDYSALTECSLKLLILKLKWIQENTTCWLVYEYDDII